MTIPSTIPAQIAEVHRVYCALSGRPVRLLPSLERYLFDYVQAGFTPTDMETVLLWLLRENKKLDRDHQRSLMLIRLISDLSVFDAFLCEATVWNRNHKPMTARQEILRATGRLSEKDMGIAARRIGDVLSGIRTDPRLSREQAT